MYTAVCVDLAMTKQKALESNLINFVVLRIKSSPYTVYFGCALRLACSRIL